jgi:hypothetical protein
VSDAWWLLSPMFFWLRGDGPVAGTVRERLDLIFWGRQHSEGRMGWNNKWGEQGGRSDIAIAVC